MLIATNLVPTSKPDARIALGPDGSQTAGTPLIMGGGRATVRRSGAVGPISSNKWSQNTIHGSHEFYPVSKNASRKRHIFTFLLFLGTLLAIAVSIGGANPALQQHNVHQGTCARHYTSNYTNVRPNFFDQPGQWVISSDGRPLTASPKSYSPTSVTISMNQTRTKLVNMKNSVSHALVYLWEYKNTLDKHSACFNINSSLQTPMCPKHESVHNIREAKVNVLNMLTYPSPHPNTYDTRRTHLSRIRLQGSSARDGQLRLETMTNINARPRSQFTSGTFENTCNTFRTLISMYKTKCLSGHQRSEQRTMIEDARTSVPNYLMRYIKSYDKYHTLSTRRSVDLNSH